MTTRVQEFIGESVARLIASNAFQKWASEQKLLPGDVVIINNSFVFRDVATTKSDRYLGIELLDGGTYSDPFVLHFGQVNADFKRLAAKALNVPERLTLEAAIHAEASCLGELLFVLIGEVLDTDVVDAAIDSDMFDRIEWDPQILEIVQIDGRLLRVRQTHDEDLLWSTLIGQLEGGSNDVPASLRNAFGVALDKLQDQAIAMVRVPNRGETLHAGITDAVITVLRDQRDQYSSALPVSGQAPSNDVLRVAYNFASDATTYIRLIVSVCDLKPLVLWPAIAEHHRLSEAFRELPWTRSRNKVSLKNYHDTIADARNTAFHNLFPFRQTLRVGLTDKALRSAELRIFSEHSKKKENELKFEDKELVDLLLEFTRARQSTVAASFWERNLEVMDETMALFERTNATLKLLREA